MYPFISEEQKMTVATIREFVSKEVVPVASALEARNEYPWALVDRFKEMGLFGCIIPQEYGGLGMGFATYALVVEEVAAGWMSLVGLFNTHLIMAYIVMNHGTPEQKRGLLPAMARGEKRGGLALTEPDTGSDVQAIRTSATRQGDHYVLAGSKMFLTNGRNGNTFALLARTNPSATPAHRGLSCFIVEKGPGFVVGADADKVGYRSIDTCQIFLEEMPVAAATLVGGKEGRGFSQVMDGLEVGRINVAARAVGVARAAHEASLRYAQQRHTFGKPIAQHQSIQIRLADMAVNLEAARLLTHTAATRKDMGEPCGLEAAMAKLFASETSLSGTMEAMRIHGGYGFTKDLPIERFYRDAPLMVIGEGTNEIQRLIIARKVLERHRVSP
ncbi:MAG: acyl-CoA dehydrogenase family protein [Dehalococcoidia bacterium]|nr:acyl-CoA dehydrogenase family protein [Dehalococcoidia bacterium]